MISARWWKLRGGDRFTLNSEEFCSVIVQLELQSENELARVKS